MKFSVICEQTRKLFEVLLNTEEEEQPRHARLDTASPVPLMKQKAGTTYPYSDVRLFYTDSKRRRRAAAMLYKTSKRRRQSQATNKSQRTESAALVPVTEKCPRLEFNSHQEPDLVAPLSVTTVDCQNEDAKQGEDATPSSSSSSSPASSSTSAYFSSTSSITMPALHDRMGILKDNSEKHYRSSIAFPNGFKKVHFAPGASVSTSV